MVRFAVSVALAIVANPAWAQCQGGSVVINELMPDPDGTDADAEWVELYNRGTEPITLDGWRVERATSVDAWAAAFTVPVATTLPPGGWLVLAGPGALVTPSELVLTVDQTADMGNAGSNSDAVRLVDCDSGVRDVIAYGNVNDGVFLDEELEQIADVKLAPKPSSGRSLARRGDGGDTNNPAVDFASGEPTPGTSNGEAPPPVICVPLGARQPVVINELLPDPGPLTNPTGSTDSGYEWVELYNPNDVPVTLDGWTLQQAGAPADWGGRVKMRFPGGTIIPAGGHLVVADSDIILDEVDLLLRVVDVTTLSLGNSEDGLRLVDCLEQPVDQVVYGGTNPDGFTDIAGLVLTDEQIAPAVSTDRSIARLRDGASTGDNGADFVLSTPTPGEPNLDLSCRTTGGRVRINEILPNPEGVDTTAQTEFVELYNDSDDPVDISQWSIVKATGLSDGVLREEHLFTFPPDTVLGPRGFYVVGGLLSLEADAFTEDFDLPSGSSGDLVLLIDCEGSRTDGVLYGGDNEDGLSEDDGFTPDQGAGRADDDQCIARRADGTDTNVSLEDFVPTRYCTPGATNVRVSPPDTEDPEPEGGCGSGPTGPREVTPGQPTGCAVSPRGGALAALALVWLRRRRR